MIRRYAPQDCMTALQSAIKEIHTILDLPEPAPTALIKVFGLEILSDHADFADAIHIPLEDWQATHWWDTAGSIASRASATSSPLEGVGSSCWATSWDLPKSSTTRDILTSTPSRPVPNFVGPIEYCFGTQDDTKFQKTHLSEDLRAWRSQVCTQWGLFMPVVAPLTGRSILSKYMTIELASKICRQAFPPGQHYIVPSQPDFEEINRRGDYAIEIDRLAFIDGEWILSGLLLRAVIELRGGTRRRRSRNV